MGRLLRVLKTSFTSGEIDPLMSLRLDIKHRYSAAARMRNVFALPQGGFERRPGLRYIGTLPEQITRQTGMTITCPNGGTTANANDDDVTTEVVTTAGVGTTDPYVVAHYDLGAAADVIFADAVGLRVDTGSGVADEFFIQYSTDDAAWTSLGAAIPITTTDNTERRTGTVSARYWRIARIGSTDLSTAVVHLDEFSLWVENASMSDARMVGFEYSADVSYMMVFSDRNVRVYKSGVRQVDLRSPYTSAQLTNMGWMQSLDTLICLHVSVAPQKFLRVSDTDWTVSTIDFDYVPKYDFAPTESNPAGTCTPAAVDGQVKLTSSAAVWTTAHVGQKVSGNGGLARIVQYNSTSVVVAVVEIPFYNTDAIANNDWTLHEGFEDAWSDARGWPEVGCFHQSRMYLAAGSLDNRFWGSRVGEFFDFEPDQALDDEPVEGAIDHDQNVKITGMRSGRQLIINTSSAEVTVPESPITPRNIGFRIQTQRGAKPYLPTVEIDGAVMFVQRHGKTIREFYFVDVEQAYTAEPFSLLSSHLIDDPVDFAKRKSTTTRDADLLMAVNTDGSLATCSVIRGQNVVAWTLQTTDSGLFKRVGVDGQDTYFMIERTVDGNTVRFIEAFDDDHYTDASSRFTTGLPTAAFTVAHLPNTTLEAYVDGSELTDVTSDASGNVTIERDAATACELGLDFPSFTDDVNGETYKTPYVRTMSLEPEVKEGYPVGKKKRIPEVTIDLYQTQNIKVNGQTVIFRKFAPAGGGTPLGAAPPIFTGRKTIEGVLGFNEEATVEIQQDFPGPMTVKGFSAKVSV